MLRRLRARVGDRPRPDLGGRLETAEDVWQRIRAGATLVQLYTAFVYEGPLLPRRLHRGLRDRLAAAGFKNVNEAIGSEAPAGRSEAN